jgi:hypothetical protein
MSESTHPRKDVALNMGVNTSTISWPEVSTQFVNCSHKIAIYKEDVRLSHINYPRSPQISRCPPLEVPLPRGVSPEIPQDSRSTPREGPPPRRVSPEIPQDSRSTPQERPPPRRVSAEVPYWDLRSTPRAVQLTHCSTFVPVTQFPSNFEVERWRKRVHPITNPDLLSAVLPPIIKRAHGKPIPIRGRPRKYADKKEGSRARVQRYRERQRHPPLPTRPTS